MIAKEILAGGYGAKLASSQWREFAKSVRRQRGNYCELCKRGGLITQVHHWCYDSGREPWDYDIQDVVVLCEGCHKALHEHLNNFRRYIFRQLTPRAFQVLNGALAAMLKENEDPLLVAYALADLALTAGAVKRMAGHWAAGEAKKDHPINE